MPQIDYLEDIQEDIEEAKRNGFSDLEISEFLSDQYGEQSARKALKPDVQQMELVNVKEVIIKGKDGKRGPQGLKGEKGDKGDTPVKGKEYFTPQEIEEFKQAVTPQKDVEYRDGVDGKDGADGRDGRDGVDGKNGTDGKDGKNALPPKHEWNGFNLRFENPDGTWGDWINLQATVKISKPHGGGGGLSASGIYTETPVGAINDVNVTYTVQNEIHNVIGFAINGMYIHPVEYSTSGKTITFTTPLPTALAGTAFSITYV